MAITPVNIGTSNNDGTGDDLRVAFGKVNNGLLELESALGSMAPGMDGEDGVGLPVGGTPGQVPVKQSSTDYDTAWETLPSSIAESIDGGAGFVNASGDILLDLSGARFFHLTMVENILSLAATNMPNTLISAVTWTLVLKVDSTGGYLLSGDPSIQWTNGGSWSKLDLSADAVNIVVFTRQGDTTYATLVWNGDTALDPYKVTFLANGTYPFPTENESIDLANFTKPAGDATIAFNKNGGSDISARTSFALGDVLNVVVTGLSSTTTIRVPRYTL